MRYTAPSAELFKLNRKNYVKNMKKGAMAIFVSNEQPSRSADAHYKWRQNPDLYYLTGVDQEETFLILFPDAPEKKFQEILFSAEFLVYFGH